LLVNGVMKLEKHIYEWDKIVIGGDLRSLLFAATHNYPVIFVNPNPPFRFDMVSEKLDFSSFGVKRAPNTPQLELWEKMLLLCGLSGLLPLSSRANSIRAKENLLVITTENLRVIKAKFKKLIIFEPDQIQSLPDTHKEEKGPNRVIDWFNVRLGCHHDIEYISFKENFIKEIYFYPTDRSDNKTLKDAVSVSYLTDKQIDNFDFSEVMSRFKVEHLMKQAGIRGPINGYRNGNPILLPLKVEHAERQIIPNIKRVFEHDDRFEFVDLDLAMILKSSKVAPYIKKLVSV